MILDLNIKVTAFTSCFLSSILIYKKQKIIRLGCFFVCVYVFMYLLLLLLLLILLLFCSNKNHLIFVIIQKILAPFIMLFRNEGHMLMFSTRWRHRIANTSRSVQRLGNVSFMCIKKCIYIHFFPHEL